MNAGPGGGAAGRLRRTLGVLILAAALAPSARAADNPQLATDFGSIMQWLSVEAAEGLSFQSSVSFAPPIELADGQVAADTSFGVGTIPLNKGTFPTLHVQQLQNLQIQNDLPNVTPFPDMTAHISLGLPGRWEIAGRMSDMSVPSYQLGPNFTALGQSNILGMEVRKHMGPADEPVTVFAGYDYLFGGFKFFNSFENIPVASGLTLNSNNTGTLDWNMKTLGAGLVASHVLGRWVPYYGFAYYYSEGHVFSTLQADFTSQLATPIIGGGDHTISSSQELRGMFGTLFKGRAANYFGGVEVLGFGSNAGQAYSFHLGVELPLGRLWGSNALANAHASGIRSSIAAREPSPLGDSVPKDLKDAPHSVDDGGAVQDNAILLQ